MNPILKRPNKLAKVPQDFNTIGDVTTATKSPAALIPMKYFAMKEFRLPMSQADFDLYFGKEFSPFGSSAPSAAQDEVFTNTAQNGLTVAEDFLLCGIQVNLTTDGRHYVQNGVLVNPSDSSKEPLWDGATLAGGTLQARAVLNHAAAIEGIANLMTSMGLRMFIRKWNMILDESWFNVGLAPWPQSKLNSDSLTSVQQDIVDTNAQLAALGCSNRFIAQNATAGGSLSPAPAPIAPVSYGVLDGPGAHGCHFYRFKMPILLLRGMPIEIYTLPIEGSMFHKNARNVLTAGATGADNCPDGQFQDGQFSDAATGLTAAQVKVATVASGKLSFGINLLGFSVNKGLVEAYLSDLPEQHALAGIYEGLPQLANYAQRNPRIARLAAAMPQGE